MSDVKRWHTYVADEAFYAELDAGIRFAVRVLHARGFETCQSCHGGVGHAYDVPTVDLVAAGRDATGFAALAALVDYGLPVDGIALYWPVANGLPYERLWRITFWKTMDDRADEKPNFIHGAQSQ